MVFSWEARSPESGGIYAKTALAGQGPAFGATLRPAMLASQLLRHNGLGHGALVRNQGFYGASPVLTAGRWVRNRAVRAITGPDGYAQGKGAFSILFENDLFYKADHDYTNGTEFSYTTAPDKEHDWARFASRGAACPSSRIPAMCVPAMRSARPCLRPTTSPFPIRLLPDRPYGGFLFRLCGCGGRQ